MIKAIEKGMSGGEEDGTDEGAYCKEGKEGEGHGGDEDAGN